MSESKPSPIPIADGLFTWPSESPQLIASHGTGCDEVAFPKQSGCPNCAGDSTDEVLLARRGKLWTWTVQHFPPPHPYAGDLDAFIPFGVGYIELPEGIRVEARLTVNEPEKLEIGMDMELVVEKFAEREDGAELVTFAFQPVEG